MSTTSVEGEGATCGPAYTRGRALCAAPQLHIYQPDGLLTLEVSKHDVDPEPNIIAPDTFATDDYLDDNPKAELYLLTTTEDLNMNTSEDDPAPGLNGRLRPRKSQVSSPQGKAKNKHEAKSSQDKPKRTSTPSKTPPNKQDDLTSKSDFSLSPQFLCPYCDRKFASRQTVSKHIRRIHYSTTKQDAFLNCLYCNHTEADTNIIRHMVDSHPNQYFACLDCHTRFPSTSELAEHKLNVCEKQKLSFPTKLRPKIARGNKKSKKSLNIARKSSFEKHEKDFQDGHEFNGIVISCELKPPQDHEGADIEDKITTNLILPPNRNIGGNTVLEKNAVIVLDDVQWNKRIPQNFSFHNTDPDQILSRLGVVHRSPRTGESTKRDWLKAIDSSTEKFERCFDTKFYSKVASNVQENLAKFLDGSFNFNPDPDSTIKTRKTKNNVLINTAEGFPILLACEQYSRSASDSYLPRAIAPKHKWKWDNLENDRSLMTAAELLKRDSHTNNCIITLVSSLDIWTQLSMRRKFEDKFNILPLEKKTEKQNIISKELKEILESREIPRSTQTVTRAIKPVARSSGALEFPAALGLVPAAPVYELRPAVLSGEWVRPRCYVCCACGEQTTDSKGLNIHISTRHPNAHVQYYEIVDEPFLNADILKHLYIPPSQVCNRTRPPRGFRECTKCQKSITLDDLHQHMLDCAGDTPAVRRRQCRHRPFGVRRRRHRMPDNNTIRKKMRKDIRSRRRQKNHLGPRPRIRTEVGDAETIRKMLADLPAKRHRVLVNPLNMMQIPRRKLDKQRAKLMMKKKSTDDTKRRKGGLSDGYSINKAGPATDDVNKNASSLEDDEDNLPLKPKSKPTPNVSIRRREALKRQAVISTAKRKSVRVGSRKIMKNADKVVQSTSSANIQEASFEDSPRKLEIKKGTYNTRENANRGASNSRDNQRPNNSGTNETANNNNTSPPSQSAPLKHSIARLTANSETHDKSVQFHHLFLVQQECNNTNEHVPAEPPRTLFENEAVVSKLDKPPLHFCQKGFLDLQKGKANKPRKGLNDCIAMLKNKLVDPVPSQNAGHVSVQCGTDEPIDDEPRLAHTPTTNNHVHIDLHPENLNGVPKYRRETIKNLTQSENVLMNLTSQENPVLASAVTAGSLSIEFCPKAKTRVRNDSNQSRTSEFGKESNDSPPTTFYTETATKDKFEMELPTYNDKRNFTVPTMMEVYNVNDSAYSSTQEIKEPQETELYSKEVTNEGTLDKEESRANAICTENVYTRSQTMETCPLNDINIKNITVSRTAKAFANKSTTRARSTDTYTDCDVISRTKTRSRAKETYAAKDLYDKDTILDTYTESEVVKKGTAGLFATEAYNDSEVANVNKGSTKRRTTENTKCDGAIKSNSVPRATEVYSGIEVVNKVTTRSRSSKSLTESKFTDKGTTRLVTTKTCTEKNDSNTRPRMAESYTAFDLTNKITATPCATDGYTESGLVKVDSIRPRTTEVYTESTVLNKERSSYRAMETYTQRDVATKATSELLTTEGNTACDMTNKRTTKPFATEAYADINVDLMVATRSSTKEAYGHAVTNKGTTRPRSTDNYAQKEVANMGAAQYLPTEFYAGYTVNDQGTTEPFTKATYAELDYSYKGTSKPLPIEAYIMNDVVNKGNTTSSRKSHVDENTRKDISKQSTTEAYTEGDVGSSATIKSRTSEGYTACDLTNKSSVIPHIAKTYHESELARKRDSKTKFMEAYNEIDILCKGNTAPSTSENYIPCNVATQRTTYSESDVATRTCLITKALTESNTANIGKHETRKLLPKYGDSDVTKKVKQTKRSSTEVYIDSDCTYKAKVETYNHKVTAVNNESDAYDNSQPPSADLSQPASADLYTTSQVNSRDRLEIDSYRAEPVYSETDAAVKGKYESMKLLAAEVYCSDSVNTNRDKITIQKRVSTEVYDNNGISNTDTHKLRESAMCTEMDNLYKNKVETRKSRSSDLHSQSNPNYKGHPDVIVHASKDVYIENNDQNTCRLDLTGSASIYRKSVELPPKTNATQLATAYTNSDVTNNFNETNDGRPTESLNDGSKNDPGHASTWQKSPRNAFLTTNDQLRSNIQHSNPFTEKTILHTQPETPLEADVNLPKERRSMGIPSRIRPAHTSIPPPLDLSGKVTRDSYLPRTVSYDNYGTLDLSNKKTDQTNTPSLPNPDDIIVDLRVRPIQSTSPQGTLSLCIKSANKKSEVIAEVPTDSYICDTCPTDLSLRGKETGLLNVSQKRSEASAELKDSTASKSISLETEPITAPTSKEFVNSKDSSDTVITKDEERKASVVKDCTDSANEIPDDLSQTVCAKMQVQSTIPSPNLIQSNLSNSKEITENNYPEHGYSQSPNKSMQIQKPIYDPTLKIPQYKIRANVPMSETVVAEPPNVIAPAVNATTIPPTVSQKHNRTYTGTGLAESIHGIKSTLLSTAVSLGSAITIHPIPGRLSTTLGNNRFESTTPVYTLANACIAVTKIESSNTTVLTNALLSIPGSTIANTTPVYTLTGTTIGTPMNFNKEIANGTGTTQSYPTTALKCSDNTMIRSDISFGEHIPNKGMQNAETKIDMNVEDPETAKKIAMLPKELVDILGNMPIDHRNQLLNVLPQYVSTTVANSLSPNSTVQNVTDALTPSEKITNSSTLTKHVQDSNAPIGPQDPSSLIQQHSNIYKSGEFLDQKQLIDQKLLPAASLNNMPTDKSYSAKEDILFTPAKSIKCLDEDVDAAQGDHKLKDTLIENKISNMVYVDEIGNKPTSVIENDRIIDLTEDENLPPVTRIVDVSHSISIPPQDISTVSKPNMHKTNNDKTASLRAVRIKAPAERQKESQKLSKTSVELPQVTDTAKNETKISSEFCKSLAIQQAEITSTQQSNKTTIIKYSPDSVPVAAAEETTAASRIPTITADITNDQDKSVKNTVPKSSVVTSSFASNDKVPSDARSEADIEKLHGGVNAETVDTSVLSLSSPETNPTSISNEQNTSLKVDELAPVSKCEGTVVRKEDEEDSEDDIILAAIVKQKQKSERNSGLPGKRGKKKIKNGKKAKRIVLDESLSKNIVHSDENSKHTHCSSAHEQEKSQGRSKKNNKSVKLDNNQEKGQNGIENKDSLTKSNNLNDSTVEITDCPKVYQLSEEQNAVKIVEKESFCINKQLSDKIDGKLPQVFINTTTDVKQNDTFKKQNNKAEEKTYISEKRDNVKKQADDKSNTDNNVKKQTVISYDLDDKKKQSDIGNNEKIINYDFEPKNLLKQDYNVQSNDSMDAPSSTPDYDSNMSAPLRRSRRGKSLFIESYSPEPDSIHVDTSADQKAPLTKKQLIFSKLLLDEEHHTKLLLSNSEKEVSSTAKNTEHANADTTDKFPRVSPSASPEVSTKKCKSIKRKSSPQLKRKSKKKKSTDSVLLSEDSSILTDESQSYLRSGLDINLKTSAVTETSDVLRVLSIERNDTESNQAKCETLTKNLEDVCTKIDMPVERSANLNKNKTFNTSEKRKLSKSPSIVEFDQESKSKKTKLSQYKSSDIEPFEDMKTKTDDEKNVTPPKPEHLTCYDVPAPARRTRSKSVVVKSASVESYDPYDIDLDEMIQKPEPLRKMDEKSKEKTKRKIKSTGSKVPKDDEMQIEQNVSDTISHGFKNKKPEFKKAIIETSLIVGPSSIAPDSKSSEAIRDNIIDSDDSSISDVPLKKYVKVKKMTADKAPVQDHGNKDVEEQNVSKRAKIMSKRSSPVPSTSKGSGVSDETEEEIRSEQFMESFGFFSERKPRKSNLLASKKISETFHIIANEGDDLYYESKERNSKRTLQTDAKKGTEGDNTPQLSKKILKRGRKKKTSTSVSTSTPTPTPIPTPTPTPTPTHTSVTTPTPNPAPAPIPTKQVSCYCEVCKKGFRRPDNMARHLVSLLHVSKVSEFVLKAKTDPTPEEPNYLIAFKQEMDLLKILTDKAAKQKKNAKNKIILPTSDEIVAAVYKRIWDQQLSRLSRDEALFLDCCELLKQNRKRELLALTARELLALTSREKSVIQTNAAVIDNTQKAFDANDSKSDGDVDSITARSILESEEIQKLENDLIACLKEAALLRAKPKPIEYHAVPCTMKILPHHLSIAAYVLARPECSTANPESIPIQAEAVSVQLESVPVQPNNGAIRAETESISPENVSIQPEIVSVQLDSVPIQGENVHVQPETVPAQAGSVSKLPESGLAHVESVSVNLDSDPTQLERVAVHLECHHKPESSHQMNAKRDEEVTLESESEVNKTRKLPEYKEKMYPDIIEDIDMFEDKFDKIKRKCRSQAAAAKQQQAVTKPSSGHRGRKKTEKKKEKKSSKKNNQNTVLTKGALKGFDGIKVSIPRNEINISAIVPSSEVSQKKKRKSSSKKKREKRDSESSTRFDSDHHHKEGSNSQKKVDVYEFMDNEDAELFEFRPSTLMERFKSISKDAPSTSKQHTVLDEQDNSSESGSDGDDFVYMSDDYVCSDDETENSLLSELGNVKSDHKKVTTQKRKDAVEKSAVMRNIFKHNAVRSEKKTLKSKETVKPRANLDQLFDSLLEEEQTPYVVNNGSDSPNREDTLKDLHSSPAYEKLFDQDSLDDIEFRSTKSSRRSLSPVRLNINKSHVSSTSTELPSKYECPKKHKYEISTNKEDNDIYAPSTSGTFKRTESAHSDIFTLKKRPSSSPKKRDKSPKSNRSPFLEDDDDDELEPKQLSRRDNSPTSKLLDSEYSADFDEDTGVARHRARRKCTVGKQNVLAETWSSESEPDGLPPRPNSAESVALFAGRKKKSKKRDGHQPCGRRGKGTSHKKQDIESRVNSSNRTSDGSGTSQNVATSRSGGEAAENERGHARPGEARPAPEPEAGPSGAAPVAGPSTSRVRPRPAAYYWSSEGDDELEHQQPQHGWIVGNSHKRLVTMLAHAKGRKRNNDDKRHLVE